MLIDADRTGLTCFSYLAAAQLLQVDEFPRTNYGTEVHDVQPAVAADGVIVATACSRLGVQARLACNPAGLDGAGRTLAEALGSHGVECRTVAGVRTPSIVVVTDGSGNRVWLPFLPNVTATLEQLDLDFIDGSAMVYVDCYELLARPALRVIRHGVRRGVRLFVNLGGSPIPEQLLSDALPAGSIEVVQTNVAEPRLEDASTLAQSLRTAFGAHVAVITAGARGAVALSEAGLVHAPAYHVPVRHVHGAGAAVSAVLACGLLQGRDLSAVLRLACAAGSWRCEAVPNEAWPSFDELEAFAAQRPLLD